MIIIYHCYGAAHSSVLSAAIHLGYLPIKRKSTIREIKDVPFFDKTTTNQIGIPFYFGSDESGNKIYIQGLGGSDKKIKQLLKELMTQNNIPEEEVVLVYTLKNVNLLVRIGGYLSRGLGLIFPGRILAAFGLKIAYWRFVKTVSAVKKKNC